MVCSPRRSNVFEAGCRVPDIVHAWDKASRAERARILHEFTARFSAAVPLLDDELGSWSSLLFTRFTTAWRLSYSLGTSVTPHMLAIRLFLRSAQSQRFLDELLAIGGLHTLLDLISQEAEVVERDKRQALVLLRALVGMSDQVCNLFCQTDGLRLCRRALMANLGERTQARAIDLIADIAGRPSPTNPRHQLDAQETLLLLCAPLSKSPVACKALALRALAQVVMESRHPRRTRTIPLDERFAGRIVAMMSLDHQQIHAQASALLVHLCNSRPELMLTDVIIGALVNIVNAEIVLSASSSSAAASSAASSSPSSVTLSEAGGAVGHTGALDKSPTGKDSGAFASLSPGARAARTLTDLQPLTLSAATLMVDRGVLRGLTHMYCNLQSYEAQQIANQALQALLHVLPDREDALRDLMGPDIFAAFSKRLQGGQLYRVFTDANRRAVREAILGHGPTTAASLAATTTAAVAAASPAAPQDFRDMDDDAMDAAATTGTAGGGATTTTATTTAPAGHDEDEGEQDGGGLEASAREDVLIGNAALNRLAVKLAVDKGVADAELRAQQAFRLATKAQDQRPPQIARRVMTKQVVQPSATAGKPQAANLEAVAEDAAADDSSDTSSAVGAPGHRPHASSLSSMPSVSRMTSLLAPRRSRRPTTKRISEALVQSLTKSALHARKSSDKAAALFVPMAIPNLQAGTVLFNQHSGLDPNDEMAAQSTEKLLQDYKDLLKGVNQPK